jgi:hypothetical protein
MAKTRKQRGGVAPLFQSATPANLNKLSKVDARDFIRGVCIKELPNYMQLIKKQRGCANNTCPTAPTPAQKQWADVETEFKTQCATAERLKLIKAIPETTNLNASYIKTTANRLIANSKRANAKIANAKIANAKIAPSPSPAPAPSPSSQPIASSGVAASIDNDIKKITSNLQAAKLVLASMAKKGGAKRNKRHTRKTSDFPHASERKFDSLRGLRASVPKHDTRKLR